MVRGNNICLEHFDSVCGGHLCKLAQQDGAESPSLKIVGDGKSDLGPLLVNCSIKSMAYYALFVATTGHESKSLVQVCLSMSFCRETGSVLQTIKSQPA